MERATPVATAARRSLDAYAAWFAGLRAVVERHPDMPLDEVRAIHERWGDHTTEPTGVVYRDDVLGGVPAIWAAPHGCTEDRVAICSHGGGYSCGSMRSHRKLYAHLAKAIGCRAAVVDYRLVPEYLYPAAVDDVLAVYRAVLAAGVAPGHVVLAGDSAGGALSVAVLLQAREQGLPLPAAVLALSPWVDLEATGASYAANAERDVVNSRALVVAMAAAVLGGEGDLHDPRLSPLHAELAGLPPMYVQVGGDETLLDDARALVAAARRAGVTAELDVVGGMQHCFQMLAGNAPQADDAIGRLAEWTAPRLGLA
jgi:monoterpene epsilon-lactone hydrolase